MTNLAQGPEVNGKTSEGLLAALEDVCFKMTRLSSGTGHRKRGDELPDLFEPDAADSTADKEKLTRQGQASRLLREARNTLTTIVRDVLESRGVDVWVAFHPEEYAAWKSCMVDRTFIGPLLPDWRRMPDWRPTLPEIANWLAVHVHSLACDESAGQWKRDVDGLVKKIEKVIDYPELPRQIGPCPTFDKKGERCNQELRARRDQARINCPKCGVNQDVKNVTRSYLERNRHRLFRLSQIERILDQIDEPVSLRTLQRWHKRGDLKPRGYWRPDGNRGTMRRSDADTPGFWLEDARRIREKSARMQEAGS